MEVAIEQQSGKSMTTGLTVWFDQYVVRVDGSTVGYLPFADKDGGVREGEKILFHTRQFSVEQRKEIERQAAKLAGTQTLSSVEPPKVPPELRQALLGNDDEELIEDDLE